MSNIIVSESPIENQDNLWDDSLLVKAYDESVHLAREELARRLSLTTSKKSGSTDYVTNKKLEPLSHIKRGQPVRLKIGDYVRATYEDGVDYEAKIISTNEQFSTCVLKYIGYENIQEVPMSDLIFSWGKKARRLQFAKARAENADKKGDCDKVPNKHTVKNHKSTSGISSVPPPPPIPPMIPAHNVEDSEHLSAMLMSWYMSGYYTGVYQGMKLTKNEKDK